MFRKALSVAALSTLGLLAACTAPTGDEAQSDDDVKAGKSDNAFLMDVLTRAGVPEVAPAKHILGVGASRTASIDLKIVSGGFAAMITKSGEISSEKGALYAAVAKADFSRLDTVLVKGGASWFKGEVRCCDIPTTDTLTAIVSCHTVVAPGFPVNCSITVPAPVAKETDDAFMYALMTNAGVTPDSTIVVPGAGTKYTAHVVLSAGGFVGVELGHLNWDTSHSASIKPADFARVEKVLKANGSIWGDIGPVHPDMESTIESYVTCSESVTAHPVAHCSYEAANIRPL